AGSAGGHRSFGLLVHHHARITGHSHFGNIQTLDFHFERHTVSDEFFSDVIDDHRENAERHKAGYDTDEFREELTHAAAIEQASHLAGDAVPAVAIGAVCEQAQRKAAPGAIDAVNGDGPHAIVNSDFLKEEYGFDHENARDKAEDAGAGRVYERAWACDRHQTRQHAVAHHGRIRFLGAHPPHPERGAESAGG